MIRVALSLAAVLAATAADARVIRLVVEREERSPATRAGAPEYRILHGRYEGDLDPAAPGNAVITDITLAPRNAAGRVAYSATFAIALPVDPARGSGVLFYDVPNRGNGTVAADLDGHIRVVSGWQGDLAPMAGAQTATVPVAAGATGTVLQRFVNMPAGTTTLSITGSIGRPTPRPLPVSLDTARAQLLRQTSDAAAPVPLPAAAWAFADCRTRPFPGTPDPTRLCVSGGFDPAQAYTLIYQGRDPLVLGIGFAAVRDLNAFLRHAPAPANPLAGRVRWPIITGTSQSGNFVKSFINLGFNADEDGRQVFAGANPNIAARQVPLNIRFGVPGGAATLWEPGSEGTLWWGTYDDRVRGRGLSSLLDACRRTATCPRIMETVGSAETWGLRMSPGMVGTDAARDLPLPPEVRRYYFPSVTHGGSYVGGFPVKGEPASPGAPRCTLAMNPNPSADTRRALLARLAEWVSRGTAPPPSRYPTIAAGELVAPTARAMGWPAIPRAPSPDGHLNQFLDYDYGRGFDYQRLSGVLRQQPPHVRRPIPSLVPRVDRDGNEVGGVPSIQLLVPIGTYTGWNELAEGYGAGGPCGFVGGFIPLARTRDERMARGDPRRSLEERYRDHAGFVARVRTVAAEQVAAGWLLPDDAARIVAEAEASDVLR
ncbi:hypothetical protein SAMN06297144_1485 [Sphingomonas guangdongensis]|uniref:Alpha/beta hydrolase domain-containing protein n=1 Tax=Sphingomonas guangdongensis TaxID=1141890 RepID=A0A285QWP1_9SPHN|nr:alpha/beta hydrolase domain-containing protein [Sphingomonas guangdongensis]SOB86380.1 hypothetical protein SAMN06297144_1485 [Sphingomonas guangdongensis]